MMLDLKHAWTNSDIAALLASVLDDRDWRLEVTKAGVAFLHDMSEPPAADYDDTLHCYFETWMRGGDFVGPSAARDKSLVDKIAQGLRNNYPTLKNGAFVYIMT
jgi:hypothetical protein